MSETIELPREVSHSGMLSGLNCCGCPTCEYLLTTLKDDTEVSSVQDSMRPQLLEDINEGKL